MPLSWSFQAFSVATVPIAVPFQARDHWRTIGCEPILKCASWARKIQDLDDVFERTVSVRDETRPRFWYFAFAANGLVVLEPVAYELHAESKPQKRRIVLCRDERGVPQRQLVAALLFVGLATVLRQVARTATGVETVRSWRLRRMLVRSALHSAVGVACPFLHLAVSMNHGTGLTPLKVLGQLCEC